MPPDLPAAPPLYAYLDWRAFVRAWLGSRASRTRSRLAAALGCSPSFVTALLHPDPARRRALSDEYLLLLPRALDLDEEAAAFFHLLVRYDQAEEGSELRDRLRAQIYADKRFREAHLATVAQYELFSRWENVAVLALAESRGFQSDPRWIREHLLPRVQVQEAQRALDLLLRLGLLRYEEEGRLQPAHPMVVAGNAAEEDAAALTEAKRGAGQTMHRWMLDRAARVLTELAPDERIFNAGTQLVPEARLPELQRMFLRWQAEWMELCSRPVPAPPKAAQTRRVRVYRLNLQFFPLSTWVEEPE